VVWVRLTPGGKDLVGTVMAKRREMLSDLLAQLTLDDPDAFATAAEGLALAADELPEPVWWQRWEQSTQPPSLDVVPAGPGRRP
jgi:hypothetical protein